jgi:hypothetical protein
LILGAICIGQLFSNLGLGWIMNERYGHGNANRISIVLGSILVLTCSTSSFAGPIVTLDFTGTVGVVQDNTNWALNGTIPLGTGAVGSITYDAGTIGVLFGSTEADYPEPSLSISVNIGGGILVWNSGTLDLGYLRVTDDSITHADSFLVGGEGSPPTGLALPAGTTTSSPFALQGDLQLTDLTNAALSDLSIPTSISLSAFSDRTFGLHGGEPIGSPGPTFRPGEIIIDLDSLTVRIDSGPNAVPEPSTFVISSILFGVVGLAGVRKRVMQAEVAASTAA